MVAPSKIQEPSARRGAATSPSQVVSLPIGGSSCPVLLLLVPPPVRAGTGSRCGLP